MPEGNLSEQVNPFVPETGSELQTVGPEQQQSPEEAETQKGIDERLAEVNRRGQTFNLLAGLGQNSPEVQPAENDPQTLNLLDREGFNMNELGLDQGQFNQPEQINDGRKPIEKIVDSLSGALFGLIIKMRQSHIPFMRTLGELVFSMSRSKEALSPFVAMLVSSKFKNPIVKKYLGIEDIQIPEETSGEEKDNQKKDEEESDKKDQNKKSDKEVEKGEADSEKSNDKKSSKDEEEYSNKSEDEEKEKSTKK